MQCCKKEGYQSLLLLAISLFVHQITRSHVLVDVLYALGFSLSYSVILHYKKMCKCIHDRIHQKIIDLANVRGVVKMYEKPSISKFKKTFVKACDPSQLDTSLYGILDTFCLLSSSFMEKPLNWQGFMADIIHGTPLPSQMQFRPVIPVDPPSYEAVYSTLVFVNEEIKKNALYCISLTFDQPLYWKEKEIKADKSPEFDSIYLKLGGFHQLISFVRAGCKLKEDVGLKELCSTVYQENALPKMIEGKI